MSEQEDGRQANAADAPAEGGASASGEFGLPPVDEIFFPPVDAFPSAVESAPGPVAPPAPPSAPVVAAPPPPVPVAAPPPPVPVAAPAPAGPPAAPATAGPSESLGRSSASYASAQPHTLQPSRVEVANQPAVIVEPEAMSAPRSAPKLPQQTMPMSPLGPPSAAGAIPASALGPAWNGSSSSAQQTARVRPPTLVIRQQSATVRGAASGPNATLVKVATFLGVLFVVVLLGSAVLFLLDRRSGGDQAPSTPAPTSKGR